MTSKWYGSENKFLTLAKDLRKIHVVDEEEFIENPFKGKLRRKKQLSKSIKARKEQERAQKLKNHHLSIEK